MLYKFLDPKNDIAFKKIFGTEKNKGILIHFLNDMIKFKENGPTINVNFLKTAQDPEIAAKKTSIVDILCKDEKGHTYIEKCRLPKKKGLKNEPNTMLPKLTSLNLILEEYHDLKEVIFLAISDFIMFPQKKNYKSDHVMLDVESHENDSRDFSFTFVL